MEVFANGKNIPTYSFGNLFTQGERLADTINIIVDRFYNDTDLSNASFLMKGVTEDGWEINQVIASKRADIKKINLKWNVSGDFTINCGNLQLELSAYYPKNDEINTIIKYSMPSVYVKPSPNGKNAPLPETIEQAVGNIAIATDEGLKAIQEKVDGFDIDEVKQRLDIMEANNAVYLARPEVIAVTQKEYDSSEHKKNSLYVIIKEK
ncbi:MAG: hypothetical protein K2I06_02590 [Ruminococcus sp.]|nr:hypothetical protein [Ruminococcus sp.]